MSNTTFENLKKWNPETKKMEEVSADDEKIKLADLIDTNVILDTEPVPFECFGKTTRMSNITLCQMIKAMFANVFHDLVGVNIPVPATANNFHVELFFEYNGDTVPEGKIRNMESLVNTSRSSSSVYERKHAAYELDKQNFFTLTRATKCLLAPYMPGGVGNNSPDSNNWHKWIQPVSMSDSSSYWTGPRQRFLLKVTGLNIHKVLQALFGNRIVYRTISKESDAGDIIDENVASDNARYEIRFMAFSKLQSGEYYVNIEQFDEKHVNEIIAKENPFMINNGVYYY